MRHRAEQIDVPIGVEVAGYVEYRASRRKPYRARVRWADPSTHVRMRASESFDEEVPANDWIKEIQRKAEGGVSPSTAKTKLVDYGRSVWKLVMRGLEDKTMDPYSAGWRKLVVPSIGHIELRQLSHGIVDRAVHSWIAEGVGKSSVKNAIAALVRVSEQAVRDGLIDSNPSRVVGWQRQYKEIEAELQNPRSLALPDFATLQRLADGLVAGSHRMADAGVPVHVLRVIAGHGSLSTTQRYLHPDRKRIQDAGTSPNDSLKTQWPPISPQEPEEEPEA